MDQKLDTKLRSLSTLSTMELKFYALCGEDYNYIVKSRFRIDTSCLRAKGDWDFRIFDLIKKPIELIFNPVVNFYEARRAQLAKCTLLTLGSFQIFKVSSDAKERLVRKATGSYHTYYSSQIKLQPWFLSLQRKTCPWTEQSDDDGFLFDCNLQPP